MTSNSLVAFAAALFGSLLGFAALIRKARSIASWAFFAGMQTLAIESVLDGISLDALAPEKVIYWQTLASVARSFYPGFWLLFSITYSRGNYRLFLVRWRFALAAAFLLPVAVSFGSGMGVLHFFLGVKSEQPWWLSFSSAANAFTILLLITIVSILLNLERTFRSAVGTMRWRIKFLVLGLAIAFGGRIYIESQRLLFSGYSPALVEIEAAALLIGCVLMAIAYLRNGFAEIDVYPSHAVLQGSFTLLLAGGYLLVVGVLAQIVARLGGAGSFQTQAFLVLIGTAALAVLLISDRFRLRIQRFVSHHFARPRHDFRKTWTLMAQSMSGVLDRGALCSTATRLISETFSILSVTTWLIDEPSGQVRLGASTARSLSEGYDSDPAFVLQDRALKGLRERHSPFDLEQIEEDWAATLRELGSTQFPNGGNRICIPLLAGCRLLGAAILADRVNGSPYSLEELDLLKCIGNQVAAGLLNIRLAEELMLAKQLEAFQTMSTFFVHDLKNVVSSLSLTLQNLPVHFDDPEFRQDALHGIATTVSRINQLISRLSVLRNKLEINPVESDLNQLVVEALERLTWAREVELVKEFHPLPKILADPERLQNVVTNLLLNAREAVRNRGQVRVQTTQRDGHAILAVTDNGCGMSPAFLKDSLFRPFHTTKKQGLGIGLFQSRMVVEAHRGSIQVESEPGRGTTFHVILPLPSEHSGLADPETARLDRTPNPGLRIPTPQSRTPNPEPRTPNSLA